MRSRELALLLRKDLSELLTSRAFWLLVLITGLLCGQSFIAAVDAYAEASGIQGGPAALSQGLSPLDGILVPALGAYDLAITLLLPFVAIRLIAEEKSSGAMKLVLQWPVRMRHYFASKIITLLICWLLALLPFAAALGLWLFCGGHLDAGELGNVLAGYTLHFLLIASLSMMAAVLMPGAANAAIAILGFTIGAWALDFMAAGRGGLLQRLASFTPTAALRSFERGLFRVDLALVLVVISLFALIVAAICSKTGLSVARRMLRSALALAALLVLLPLCTSVRTSFDLSENRRNSFSSAQTEMLGRIQSPLEVTIFLAAEDPRMADFTNVLVKMRRALPRLRERYPLEGRAGLFENDDRYGEIVLTLGQRTEVTRSTTEEILLESIGKLAGSTAPPADEPAYPGYPLAKKPRGAFLAFYLLWPVIVGLAWITSRFARRNRRTG